MARTMVGRAPWRPTLPLGMAGVLPGSAHRARTSGCVSGCWPPSGRSVMEAVRGRRRASARSGPFGAPPARSVSILRPAGLSWDRQESGNHVLQGPQDGPGGFQGGLGPAGGPRKVRERPTGTADDGSSVAHERSSVTDDRPSAAHERSSMGDDRPSVTHERSSVGDDGSSLIHERSSVADDRSSATHERSSVADDRPSVAPLGPSVAPPRVRSCSRGRPGAQVGSAWAGSMPA